MVLVAVLFLTVTVGAGVNLSLEACNRMVGRSLAPGVKETYQRQAPAICQPPTTASTSRLTLDR